MIDSPAGTIFGVTIALRPSRIHGDPSDLRPNAGTWSLVEFHSGLQPPLLACLLFPDGAIYAKHSTMVLGEAWPTTENTVSEQRNVIRNWP